MEPPKPTRLRAREWFRGCREMYDSSAGSLLTELGLFYDRHRRFIEFGQRSDPTHPEYTDEEWDRVMTTPLGQMAEGRGLIQTPRSKTGPSWSGTFPASLTDRQSSFAPPRMQRTRTSLETFPTFLEWGRSLPSF